MLRQPVIQPPAVTRTGSRPESHDALDEPERGKRPDQQRGSRMRVISHASSRIDNAMVASTGGPGTWMTPSVASASVIECASVNDVIVHTSVRVLRTIST